MSLCNERKLRFYIAVFLRILAPAMLSPCSKSILQPLPSNSSKYFSADLESLPIASTDITSAALLSHSTRTVLQQSHSFISVLQGFFFSAVFYPLQNMGKFLYRHFYRELDWDVSWGISSEMRRNSLALSWDFDVLEFSNLNNKNPQKTKYRKFSHLFSNG